MGTGGIDSARKGPAHEEEGVGSGTWSRGSGGESGGSGVDIVIFICYELAYPLSIVVYQKERYDVFSCTSIFWVMRWK